MRESKSSVFGPSWTFIILSVDLFCVAKIWQRGGGGVRDGQKLTALLLSLFFAFRATFRATIKGTLDMLLLLSLPPLTALLPHPWSAYSDLADVSVACICIFVYVGICVSLPPGWLGLSMWVCACVSLEGFRFQTSNLRISSAAYKILYLFLVCRSPFAC